MGECLVNTKAESPYDIVGIGFGPSNLALAIAVDECAGATDRRLSALYLERQPSFGWHRNMLLPHTTMQVSFLKDLATFRNPLSRFTFVNYLHQSDRLVRFVNNHDFFPTRAEFHCYLEWAEAQLRNQVRYGCEALSVRPAASDNGRCRALSVQVRDVATGQVSSVTARNLVISTGLVPRVPACITLGERVWHSSQFLARFRKTSATQLRAVAVVGAGQSAAEITRFLHDELPDSQIFAIVPAYGYTVADSTPFANQVFDPRAVDDYYFGTDETRESFWRYHRNTNYSVVDDDLIRDLYRRSYEDDLLQRNRLHVQKLARVSSVRPAGESLLVMVDSQLDGASHELRVDAVVLATGYDAMQPSELLGELAAECPRDAGGRLIVGRDYRVATSPRIECGIYLQGGTEHSHGLSASLLSNIAVRSGEIVDSILRRHARPVARGTAENDPSGRAGEPEMADSAEVA